MVDHIQLSFKGTIMESNIFAEATRLKVRFNTSKGNMVIEDLWDLPLQSGNVSLDSIAVGLHKELEEVSLSFVEAAKAEDTITKLKFSIVKHIIDSRLKEIAESKRANELNARKEVLLNALDNKEKEAVLSMSRKEIKKELKELE